MKNYESKNYEYLLGIEGFSDNLLKNHFTLYQGYVANFNKLNDVLAAMEKDGKFSAPEFAELNRRFGWEFNGMRLHEYYFENLTPKQNNFVTGQVKELKEIDKESELYKAISEEWGSYELFEKDFKAMGAMRGIGWIVLYYDFVGKRLFNVWINEHDAGHFAGAAPMLVMDVFEHAYMLDYGLKKADYIEAFFKNVNWDEVRKRFDSLG